MVHVSGGGEDNGFVLDTRTVGHSTWTFRGLGMRLYCADFFCGLFMLAREVPASWPLPHSPT